VRASVNLIEYLRLQAARGNYHALAISSSAGEIQNEFSVIYLIKLALRKTASYKTSLGPSERYFNETKIKKHRLFLGSDNLAVIN
jgi:hypothetical protein